MPVTTAPRARKAPKPDIDVGRLCDHIKAARLSQKGPREARVKFARQIAGPWYSENASAKKRPLNLLGLYVDIESRLLISKNPRAMLSTTEAQHRAAVKVMQRWMNQAIEDQNLADVLKRAVVDALTGFIGILKVAISSPADAANSGYNLQAGQPYVCEIDPDDFVFDHHARKFGACSFMGHRMRMPLDVARSVFSARKNDDDLQASTDSFYNQQGDERISMIGRTTQGSSEEWEDMIDLWEIYVPRKRMVYTFITDGDGGDPIACSDGKPLKEQEWIGPNCGPYHVLGFGVVPGNCMPKGPIMDLFDLDEAINNIYRKLLDQAHRQKSVLPVRGGATDDAGRLQQANDGEMYRCDNEAPKEAIYGGPNAAIHALGEQLRQVFNIMAGNMEMKGGLSPQSKTLGQDKLLAENAGTEVTDKQDNVVRFTSSVLDSFGWFHWNHPHQEMDSEYTVQGVPDISAVQTLHPFNAKKDDGQPQPLRRQAQWEDIDHRVDPYSLQHQTPGQRLQFLSGLVQQLQPMMPLLQQQGVMFDVNFWLTKIAEYADSPDLAQMFTIQEPPQPDQQGGEPESPGMPANTNRSYTRENRSEVTGPGQSKATIQALLGQNPGGRSDSGSPS